MLNFDLSKLLLGIPHWGMEERAQLTFCPSRFRSKGWYVKTEGEREEKDSVNLYPWQYRKTLVVDHNKNK